MSENKRKIMISAGEISGDMYGAAIVRELRRIFEGQGLGVEVFGIGGDRLRDEGAELFAHASETGVMGFWEVLKRYGFFSRLLKTMTGLLDSRSPDLLLTIDYPGFNLRLAAQAKKRGIKTVHFICPQVWAWHKSRIPKIARIFDKLLCIFPFEPALFDGTGLDAVFCGHPLPEQIAESLAAAASLDASAQENLWETPPLLPPPPKSDDMAMTEAAPAAEQLATASCRRIALFPGSRASEIARILPIELEAAAILEKRVGACAFTIPAPSPKAARRVEDLLPQIALKPSRLKIIEGNSRRILKESDAAAIKSGTSTLEACILLCPSVIVYRMSAFSAFMIRQLATSLRFVGLPNILAKKQVCRELIQSDLTAHALASELEKLLTDANYRETMLADMRTVNAGLCGDSATPRAASEIAKLLLK